MPLKIESGDVFNELLKRHEAGEGVIFVHGCNAKGVMGSGVAALVKKLYPHAFEAYKQEYNDFGFDLGSTQFVKKTNITSVIVCNAITQENYGRDGRQYVSYVAVIKALESVRDVALADNLPVYLPMIGGGLGGGDVKRLTAIFQAVFHDVDATLWLKED
jgi:O-acetyl-ADP-ribose deacetylase (regulator of RNase III)